MSVSTNVASKIGTTLESKLMTWKLTALMEACRKIGAPSSGTKPILAKQLSDAIKRPFPPKPWTFVSLDLGIYNFATAIVRVEDSTDVLCTPKVLEWSKEDLGLPEIYEPEEYCRILKSFAEDLLSNKYVDPSATFLMEKQTFRGGGVRMIPGHIITLNRIETILHCFLLERSRVSIDARNVANLYTLPPGSKKNVAVTRVTDIIHPKPTDSKTQKIEISPKLITYFTGEKKKDDLADSLLQALAFIHWRTNLEGLRDTLLPK